ncbi:TPA: TetR family transcriptional regulator [Providencia alcalifaciens]|uniref:TetR family transcriptional regulator n=1 Tax=Providencia rettgeri TaxID=587 RepID=A0AAJ6FRR1_PRORE|nr:MULTISPECIES: TetR family transcriptional regulator [Providencia]EJD6501549.1 TetR family transcriptional regulator [Providencia rettgeri]MBQ0211732.1 TetR family transcriptional regulator [Providencia rettgeri]WHT81883.1 TetR family transcriptional regulator [Providencia rettgeri]WHT96027.1 TetR family transcriptional regulator [Providencia rettgeri]WJM88592.1 TetR family transcriptional regulator [Providencia rettgeri]
MAINPAQRPVQGRSKTKTLDVLNKAIDNVIASNEKLSITSVARTASVTPGLIHNTYPMVAERIRILMGKSARNQRDLKNQALINEKAKNKALRAEKEQLLIELSQLASVNQRLIFEMAKLKAVSCGNVAEFTTKIEK